MSYLIFGGYSVLILLLGILAGEKIFYRRLEKEVMGKNRAIERYSFLFNVCYEWLIVEKKKRNIGRFFENSAAKSVAIYGMGKVGKLLLEDLREIGVDVAYGIDMKAAEIRCGIPMMTLKDPLPDVDMVIITVADYEEVKGELRSKISGPLISVLDLLDVCNT